MALQHPTALPPLLTDEDVLARVAKLVGTAITDRQLWLMLVDGDGRQSPVVMPISGMPRNPDVRGLAGLSRVLSGLRAELATAEGPGAVILTRERRGSDLVSPLDRAWAQVLTETCRKAEMALRGVYLSTPGGVQRVQ
ncbi:MAG: hypothetical protein QOH17_3521 [Pseudonocardiales bacterium]|jgi:hypothetical protein|nr:hypothetical protein [Pseudonocardiales bacterium]